MIYFITGGERSGKSRFAQKLALSLTDKPVYLATARKWDTDFEKRIALHQADRDERWINVEEETYISTVSAAGKNIVVDCLTLWLTNIFLDHKHSLETAMVFARHELDKVFLTDNTWIIISNEIGMGVHATTEIGRKFVELQGWINQYAAQKSDEVYLMVSGIPLKVK